MANLLLHTCCGPCATYTVARWRQKGLIVGALWFNPNIHPWREQQLRQGAMEQLSRIWDLPLIAEPAPVADYFTAIRPDRAHRCAGCFYLRLSQTARVVKREGWDAFSTTLLLSPYQKHDLLREVAERVSEENGVPFLYQDLRSGYPESRRLSREMGLYRQSYCGCIYSLLERLAGQLPPISSPLLFTSAK